MLEASTNAVPVTLAGAGTGLTGGSVAVGGWSVSLEKFTSLVIEDGIARVCAGVPLRDLQAATSRTRQFYAPDPTETWASIGGTVATNASGSRSFRYGDTRRHVRALRIMFADGTVRHFERGQRVDFPIPPLPVPQTTKHTAGYFLRPEMDWVDLFIGSEGTLGIVIEAELMLLPAVDELLTAVVFFGTDEKAFDAVDAWRAIPRLRMLEYMDRGSLELLCPKFPEIPAHAHAALLIEQELNSEEELDLWPDLLEQAGAMLEASWFAAAAVDRERFRRFRHALPEAVNETVRRAGSLKMGTDFAVPLANNRAMLAAYREYLEPGFSGRHVIFGHIGDAHLHVNLLPSGEAEAGRAQELISALAGKAVALGGTVSAEHGLGKRKAHLLELQFTHQEIAAMKSVKTRLDPQWILGRGTLFPYIYIPPLTSST